MTDVAQTLGVSRATVSKALNHCAGVGSEKREEILKLSEEIGLCGKSQGRITARSGIYIILPETPLYFWGRLYDHLYDELNARGALAKFNIYSKLGDDVTVKRYLKEARELDSAVLIIATHMDSVRDELEQMAEHCAVFVISSSGSCKNAFDFGSNYYRDGAALCRHCVEENPGIRRILLLGEESDRTRGFTDTFDGEARHIVVGSNDTPAALARRLDSLRREFDFEAAACLDGIGRIMLMALKKLNIKVPCYGFEQPPIEERYGMIKGKMCQDLKKIAEKLAQASEEYLSTGTLPETKHIYIESKYTRI